MRYPILVTLLKMQPHYSQSSHENATPSSGTSPLASYKEVPSPSPFPHPLVEWLESMNRAFLSILLKDVEWRKSKFPLPSLISCDQLTSKLTSCLKLGQTRKGPAYLRSRQCFCGKNLEREREKRTLNNLLSFFWGSIAFEADVKASWGRQPFEIIF